jgi:hypothetical protein
VSKQKQRITNKKHTKLTYGQELARPASRTGIRAELASSDKDEDKEKLLHMTGRKSFEEIAIEQGVFDEITDAIVDFVIMNPFYSQLELMEYLKNNYNSVFGKSKTKYPQNFYKCIECVDKWREALASSLVDPKRAILRNLHKRAIKGLREEIDSSGKVYEIGMKDKDAMDYIRLLHDMEEWDKEKSGDTSNSEETINTLNEIEKGLQELGGGLDD